MNIFIILFAILLIWNILLTYFFVSYIRFYRKLKDGITGYSLHDILQSLLTKFMRSEKKLECLETEVSKLKEVDLRNFSEVGLVRFNPYEDTGGNQSFSFALLNKAHDGVVITSLHGRSGTRVYAKGVKAGDKDEYELSGEEKEAILLARGGSF